MYKGDYNDLEGDRQQGREYEGCINIDPVWTGPSRSNDESSDILDFLLLRWNAGIDVHSGVHDGDASQRDFSQDMAQENGSNDMIGGNVNSDEGPGPKKGSYNVDKQYGDVFNFFDPNVQGNISSWLYANQAVENGPEKNTVSIYSHGR